MDIFPFVTFLVAALSSAVSGIAGGGGGFLMAPYWLIAGLTPAQGAATGAFMALGMGGGSLFAFRGTGLLSRRRLTLLLLAATFAASMVGPFFLNSISGAAFKPILTVITLASLPLLFVKPSRFALGRRQKAAGLVWITAILLMSSFVASSAFSILINIILFRTFRFSVLEGTAVRRLMGITQSIIVFTILAALGNFVWTHALAGIIGGTIGSYFGTKIALRGGELFAKYALVGGAIVGLGVMLLADT